MARANDNRAYQKSRKPFLNIILRITYGNNCVNMDDRFSKGGETMYGTHSRTVAAEEELIGILSVISIVSGPMTRNLRILADQSQYRKGGKSHE